jgi:Arc/MetJ-type ribon-helix-helix transcriptional regulator
MTNENELPRQRLTISLSKEVLEWIDQQIKEGAFYNRSHAIEKCLLEKMKEKKG